MGVHFLLGVLAGVSLGVLLYLLMLPKVPK